MTHAVSLSLETLTDYDPDSLSVDQARQLIRRLLLPVDEHETVTVSNALQRTLAVDVQSPLNVPAYDNSAMDGYAIRFADLANNSAFNIAGSAYAGHAFLGNIRENECVRIMTGAPVPTGCDCVVMQEHVKVENGKIVVGGVHRQGQNIRHAGEDIQQGATVFARGQTIHPAEMGLLASLGFTEIRVFRKLRVAIFSTGDEIQQPGLPLTAGQIYDSNRYTLLGLLQALGVEILDLGCVPDNQPSLREALLSAAAKADALITSGGVSVGEADYMKQLLAEVGEVVFWKIAMKPGRPLAYGKIGTCHFFGLPGNPVAVMVTFQQFVSDALRILMGQHPSAPFTFAVRCASPLRKLPGRMEFQRGILTQDEQGNLQVRATGSQSSGVLSSMSHANCFVVLPSEQGDVAAGDIVQVQPFNS